MRRLLASTALVAMISGSVLADTQSADRNPRNQTLHMFDVKGLGSNSRGYLATNMMGKQVYTTADGGIEIGDVNDILVGEDGTIQAIIVGVGGFLGIADKDVPLDFGLMTLEPLGEGQFRVVTAVSKQELEDALPYERPVYIPLSVLHSSQLVGPGGTKGNPPPKVGKERPARENIVDHEAFMADKTVIEFGSVSAEHMMGANVYDAAGNHVGEIGDVIVSADGTIDAAIIEVGGFLGIGEKPVAIGFEQVEILRDGEDELYITTSFSQEQLEQAKTYNEETWVNDRDAMRIVPRG